MEDFSLPPETHIGHAHLQIADLERSLAFYKELLGFKIIPGDGAYVSLSASGDYPAHILLSARQGAMAKPPRTTGLYHVAIRLPNRPALAQLFQRLIERNWPFQGFADHKVSEALYLADPDSNGLELYVDRPRDLWPRPNGQVEMATDPLDVGDLLNQAGATPGDWAGIHPETDIGHIHLQVADLAQSEQFYHHWLGFDVTQRSYPGALFLSAGGYHHHIGTNVWAGRAAPPPPAEAAGLVSFSVWLPRDQTLRILLERIQQADIKIEETMEYADSTGVLIRDPAHIAVELLVPREG